MRRAHDRRLRRRECVVGLQLIEDSRQRGGRRLHLSRKRLSRRVVCRGAARLSEELLGTLLLTLILPVELRCTEGSCEKLSGS